MASLYNYNNQMRGRGRGTEYIPHPYVDIQPGRPQAKSWIKTDPASGFYKLYVSNIPSHWNETMLGNVFRKVAPVAGVYLYPPNHLSAKTWGFVEYQRYNEASEAIKKLNGNMAFDYIKVQFAKEKLDEDYFEYETLEEDPLYDIVDDPEDIVPMKRNASRVSHPPSITSDDNKPDSKIIRKPVNQSSLSTSITLCNTLLPEEREEDIIKLERSLFERILTVCNMDPDTGKCEICGKSTKSTCSDCTIHYCSKDCQAKNWPIHSKICVSLDNREEKVDNGSVHGFTKPAVVKDDPRKEATQWLNKNDSKSDNRQNRSMNNGNNDNGFSGNKRNFNVDKSEKPRGHNDAPTMYERRRLKMFPGNEPNGYVSEVIENGQSANQNKQIFNQRATPNKDSSRQNVQSMKSPDVLSCTKPSVASSPVASSALVQNSKAPTNSYATTSPILQNTKLQAQTTKVTAPATTGPVFSKLLPQGTFTKVEVIHAEESHLSVTPVSLSSEMEEFSARIQKEAESAATITTSTTKCLARSPSTKLWGRGRILDQHAGVVKFVDFGKTEICQPADLREISPQLMSTSPYVVYIKPKVGTVEELSKKRIFSISPLYKDQNGCWLVDVEPSQDGSVVTSPSPSSVSPMTKATSNEHPALSQPSKPSPQSLQEAQPIQSVQQVKPSEADFPGFLKRNEVTGAVPLYIEPDGKFHHMALLESLGAASEMTAYINKIEQHEVLTSPKIGDIGIYYYIDSWCRVKVISTTPFNILCIDYGNVETIEPGNIKVCPSKYRDHPPFAQKVVVLAPGTHEQLTLPECVRVTIKPVSLQSDGIVAVEIQDNCNESANNVTADEVKCEKEDKPEQVASDNHEDVSTTPVEAQLPQMLTTTKLKNVVDLLEKGYEMQFVCFKMYMAKNELFGSIYNNQQFKDNAHMVMSNEFEDILEPLPYDPSFKPKEGELVALKEGGLWHRAVVLEVEKQLWLSLVDDGTVVPYTQCKKIPPQFSRLPLMGAVLKLPSPEDFKLFDILQKTDKIQFTVVEVKTNSCTVQVSVNELTFIAELEKWEYDILAWPLPIPTGSSVDILKAVNPQTYLVVPKDDSFIQKIIIEVNNSTPENLKSPPEVGDYVVYHDSQHDMYYRTRVEQIDKGLYNLYDIDNAIQTSGVTFDSLYQFSESLFKIPCRINPVTLKDVDQKLFNDSAKKYILSVTTLKLDVDSSYSTYNLVTLTTEDNIVINKKLQELLTMKIEPFVNGKFMDKLLIPATPPLNKVLKLQVTHFQPLFLHDFGSVKQFVEELHNPLQTYVESIEPSLYNPCRHELCLVLFDGEWYRATCLKETNTGISTVLLVDYGNILDVSTTNIREMNADFLKYPCVGIQCQIIGLPEYDQITPELEAKVKELMPVNSTPYGTFEHMKDDIYYVNIPAVLNTLKEQNLIS